MTTKKKLYVLFSDLDGDCEAVVSADLKEVEELAKEWISNGDPVYLGEINDKLKEFKQGFQPM